MSAGASATRGRRGVGAWAWVLAAGLGPAASGAGAAGGTLTDQAVSLVLPASHWGASPGLDLLGTEAAPATDVLYRSGWWYRLDGDPREYPFPPPDSEAYQGPTLTAVWTNVDGRGFEAREQVELFDLEGPSGAYTSELTVRTSTTPSVGVTVFHVLDADVAGSGGGDTGMLVAPGFLRFREGTSTLRYRAPRAQHFMVRPYASGVEALLNDAGLTELDDTGLPFGPGDATAAFQFQRVATLPNSTSYLSAGAVEVASRPARLPKCDYLGLGPFSALLFQDAAGQVRGWDMRRTSALPGTYSLHGAQDPVQGCDDFDGDAVADLVRRNAATGVVTIANQPLTGAPLMGPEWIVAATGDFDADGKADLLWRNSATQKLIVWLMDGPARVGSVVPTPDQAAAANWAVSGAADLNGDGHRDLLWYNQTTGKIVAWYMDGALARLWGAFINPASVGNNNWKVVGLEDYGGGGAAAGSADVVWQNDTSQNVVVWHMDLAGNRTSGTFTSPANAGAGYRVVAPR